MPAGFLTSRPLGSTGLDVSAMSLGSWRTYERLPAETGVAVLRAAWDEGINFFDDARYDDETHAAPMRTGYSEVVFGRLFRAAGVPRDQAVVANKLWWEFWPEQSAAAELDASLRRMEFDHVDLIYANEPPEALSLPEMVAVVGGLLDAGKARAWGMVNWRAERAAQAVEAAAAQGLAPPCAIQLPYSLVRRAWAEDPVMAGALQASGAGMIASFCLAGGVLSGKYRPGAAGTAGAAGPGAGRAAGTLDDPRVTPAVAAAEELAALAARLDTTPAALALAFPFTNPAVASVLFGATSADQVRANCAAVSLLGRLSPDETAAVRRVGLPADLPPDS
ncbi:MAG TPA: aldo/keto reductase [Streptosporangiaceae bacterium]|nr:aldo/keto reductase [Streptosporangiaceae bacterium]